ncbi:MAG: hypothetical protein L0Z73_05210 [Gammaproteobacteria bacterium]|nr:hypothetical protein [Gammaproteobacteria bacterium]
MQSGSSDLFKLNSVSSVRHSGLGAIEWLIAVMFIITLLISSGVFFKVSNAADNRIQAQVSKPEKTKSVALGTIGAMNSNMKKVKADSELLLKKLAKNMDGASCELIP